MLLDWVFMLHMTMMRWILRVLRVLIALDISIMEAAAITISCVMIAIFEITALWKSCSWSLGSCKIKIKRAVLNSMDCTDGLFLLHRQEASEFYIFFIMIILLLSIRSLCLRRFLCFEFDEQEVCIVLV